MTTEQKRELLIVFCKFLNVHIDDKRIYAFLSTLPDEGEKCTEDKHIPGCKHEGTNDEKRITEF
jgi:hypothetical protein